MDGKSLKPRLEGDVESSNVGIGYPSSALPQRARASAIDALGRKQTHYVGVPGIDPLRDAAAGFLAGLGLDVPVERVIVTAGVQEACFLALQGMVRPYSDTAVARGDRKARYLAVYDVVYDGLPIGVPAVVAPGVQAALAVRDRRVAVIPVDRTEGLLPSVAAIEQVLEQGSKLIYLESPSRLTGFVYRPEQVQRIAELLEAHDALCVWDQSVAPAVAGEYVSLAAILPERAAAIGELWPGMGMENWRMGYVAAPGAYVESLVALKQVMSICTSAVAQWGAVGASEVFAETHAKLKAQMDAVRRDVLSVLSGDDRVLAGQAVNTLALKVGKNAGEMAQQLLAESVPATEGAAFGAPDVVRITIELDVQVKRAICNLLEGVSSC